VQRLASVVIAGNADETAMTANRRRLDNIYVQVSLRLQYTTTKPGFYVTSQRHPAKSH